MTSAEILARLRIELAKAIATINEMRVHDARVQGQLESLTFVTNTLESLGAPVDPLPRPVPQEKETAASPVTATRPKMRATRRAR